ncbi:bifunctional diguanylate cyclase/phosphodiesterase [sulfur-oxidizing endosymbiont of Gigantopelta aegis]|uniref:bifunctional diguanylate cyclase/phosphodiesterase n=1 Tax=sulfur-oxidizing endosymbiont of Gigantopelta aegis TaxID=2794934 RepID=UPI0018DECA40|nr:EAL domain-containing protein [sulfur-oxidizing endosymbiont of Gigantopelta aegis]
MCVRLSIATLQRLNEDFKADVSNVNRTLGQQISSVETILISLTGLHHASDHLNQAELSSFSEQMLKAYPFVDAIIGMEKVSPNAVHKFEQRMNKQGYINLQLIKHDTNEKKFFLPINFVEPMTPISARLLGIDIYSQANIISTINHAIDSGKIAASKITHDLDFKQPSILMLKTLYLGRYPPKSKTERTNMLYGLMALKIDINNFIAFLDLKKFNLKGNLNNLSGAAFSDNKTNEIDFKVSLTQFVFVEKFRVYGQDYQLNLERDINLKMISLLTIFSYWLISIFIYIIVVRIILKRQASEEKIRYLAYYDSLTTLPNRTTFKERLQLSLQESKKDQTTGAILFMDIDEFKRINDTLGHDVGDELLKQVSKRLTQQMRQNDSLNLGSLIDSKNFVTRLGGDEFTLLLNDIKNKKSAGLVANRILEHISQPFHLKHHEVYVTSSIGIALFPRDGNNVEQLLKHADIAMYHAKNMGKNNYQFYLKEMSSHSEKRLDLELKLHQALENHEFQLHYQPQIDTHNNKIVAAEALIRWQQSELGMVYPDDFISLAEETGQIFTIGEWVINEACRQNKIWQDAGLEPTRIAVNLSSLQFMQEGLCQMIADILHKTQLKPEYLELEITETIMMRNIEQTIAIINELSEMGINVSVDDFGTGYSSLSYLKKFPLESLKIDKSFVLDIPEDKDDMMITSAIISMAKSLNLKVVAEGVESSGQVEFLKQHQCDFMQGYYFSRPVAADDFATLLAKLYFD